MTEEILKLRKSKQEADRLQCIEFLKEYLKANEKDSLAWYYMASCLDFLGNEPEAEKNYQKALALGITSFPINEQKSFYVGYGSTLRNNKNLEASKSILEEGIKLFPEYLPLKIFLAFTLYSSEKYQKASEILFNACLNSPDNKFDGYKNVIQYYLNELIENKPLL